MNIHKNLRIGWILLCVCFLLSVNGRAEEPASEEWVDIAVVVNIIDASDANNVDDAVKKANKILEQAHIRLIVKKTNRNVNVGNGDADLSENDKEHDKALEDGLKELNKVLGAGKGIKITVADNVWVEEPNNIGWAIHRNPVVFVESGADANEMGETMAHEISHVLTLDHVDDPNNLMRESELGGIINLDPNQIKEIFQEAKPRGTSYLRKPQALPNEFQLGPSGLQYGIDGYGAILDPIGDVLVRDLSAGTAVESDDPSFMFADLREVRVFVDDPCDPFGLLNVRFQLGGLIPPSQTDFFADLSFFFNGDGSLPDGAATIHRSPEGSWTALWRDASGSESPLEEPRVFENEKYDSGIPAEFVNQTLEVDIPIEILSLDLIGSLGPGGQTVSVSLQANTWVADRRNDALIATILQDTTDRFFLSLTGHPAGPEFSFIHNGVAGSGFSPNADVGIWLDGNMIDSTQTNDDGIFFYTRAANQFESEPFSHTGIHSVIAKELDDSGPNGAAHTMGFFEVPEPFVLNLDTFMNDPVGPVNQFTTNEGVLGDERDFSSQANGPGATGDFQFSGDSLKGGFNFPESGFAGFNFIYDGTDGSQNRDFRGLGGVDATNGGVNDEFFLTINHIEGSWSGQFFVHTDATNYLGTFLSPLPTEGPFPQEIVIPLGHFNATGNPSFKDVGLIGVFYGTSPTPGEQSTSIELGPSGFRSSESSAVNAVKPFGAIDIPAHGGEASGSAYRCQGWVLTPMPNKIPEDGSTINVYIDGINAGNATYNVFRSDIATLFPGYANSNGAGAYFEFDTTSYENGVHSISWSVADNAGNADGIGSRYFMIQNQSAQ